MERSGSAHEAIIIGKTSEKNKTEILFNIKKK